MTHPHAPLVSPAVLQAQNLSLHTPNKTIVSNVTLQVHSGEMLGLIGPNGSGKSTLLRMLAGVIKPSSGQVTLNGKALQKRSRRAIARELALVSQTAETLDAITVQDAVELGRTPWLSAMQPLSPADIHIVQQALTGVGMLHLQNSTWHTLSGGERQRVHIARALAQQPHILLLDEPNNHLDIHQQLSLMQLIENLPITKVIALHDLNQALRCDCLAVMHQGQLVASGTPQDVLTHQLLAEVFDIHVRELIDPHDGSRVLRFIPSASSH